ncbi:hypothetical protein [Haloarchaeobius sp. HRN-SO-5]|uniref:hypothetical protein n=1 Tax=Haloarchaeobius sp. HRN-SO-5 TaxID=3446118 RepID=UPI003EBB4FD3
MRTRPLTTAMLLLTGSVFAYSAWSNALSILHPPYWACQYIGQTVHLTRDGTLEYAGTCGVYPYTYPVLVGASVVASGSLAWGGWRVWKDTVDALRT